MSAANFAAALPFAILAACLYRARLLALALIPPCALILARSLELIDTSSASHPLRLLVPIASLSLAMWTGWLESRKKRASRAVVWASCASVRKFGFRWQRYRQKFFDTRALFASILVFASGCADIPALLAWRLPGEWVLVPLQIAVCLVVVVVLLTPERWFAKWTSL